MTITFPHARSKKHMELNLNLNGWSADFSLCLFCKYMLSMYAELPQHVFTECVYIGNQI